MSKPLFIKPKPKTLVRNPERNNEHVAAIGAKVVRNAYWLRRLRDGDVTEIEQAEFEKAVEAEQQKIRDAAKKAAAAKAAEAKTADAKTATPDNK